MKLSSKDVGADLPPNLPDHVDICFGGGIVGCGLRSPYFVNVEPGLGSSITTVELPNSAQCSGPCQEPQGSVY